ncbi:inositol-pentakisphosphate 2-kinase isoform X1 [Pseudomyrmex gracilis]|uniref:inositol-pentakisphosphate 2-kinase isoform X1 n=2 Tax=Pseudomyrmex gracilis TaxID=219809 RepID=UPI0009949208|nr:inositol-pentakisphosphate 2-kinase isoform X1 [Pseudomyrmex gracilis]XP_020288679.1 inositol-pentakisphosphate 2-kinase isoform X1 [Pseudomyrmex gracilis]XP_020288681.1 inositol-pentakisphosphate 2-kinase isoform X1 [Pseudomyrmex gracilis]
MNKMKTDEERHSEAAAAHPSESSSVRRTGNPEGESSFDSSETSLPPFPAKNVVYKGEGNANIVIALPHRQGVIRFRKSLPDEVSPDAGETRVLRELGYARNVVSAFLGSYMQIPEIVRYDSTDVAKLSDAIRHLRPETRRHKDIANTYALKFADYTLLDPELKLHESVFRSRSTFCVEIKPKQGFLQRTEWEKIPTCPYCLNQFTKLLKKNIADLSNYCPFDLFSGTKERMKNAVRELLKSPQNNLKIFKDGLVVYDQNSSPGDLEVVLDDWFRNAITTSTGRTRVEEFCDLVYAALTRPFARERLKAFPEFCSRNLPSSASPTFRRCAESSAVTRAKWYLRLKGKKCNFDGEKLPKDSVLERIWNMQRLSYVSVGYIYDLYSKFALLLNDDLIYSDLTKVDETCFATIPQKIENARLQTPLGAAKHYSDDLNGNPNSDSNGVLSSDKMNSDFVSHAETSLNQHSFNESHNARACDDERETNVRISDQQLSALQSYLLFAMARDCSILMTFRELHPESSSRAPAKNTLTLSEQLSFVCSVRISDLDPKSVHSIKKHQQRDVEMFESVNSLYSVSFYFDITSRIDNCTGSRAVCN